MSLLSDRLAIAMHRAGISQAELARRAKVTRGAVNQWVNGSSKTIDIKYLFDVAQALDVSPKWLASGEVSTNPATKTHVEYVAEKTSAMYSPNIHNNADTISPDSSGMIPLISEVQAGDWMEANDNFEPGDAEDWLPAPTKIGAHAFALRVIGDSMVSLIPGQRSYQPGTIIYVDPDKQITNGARVVAKLTDTNEVTFKTFAEDMGKQYLRPINTSYPPLEINGNCEIIGVVVGSYTPE